ncbi:ABC transporter [Limnochorda pilosa]|uniref:ABC transporter n=1 Tax=Limnochorda pilosa TaxID=1555112 RepID=A0A0K2SGC2_LIMPI|nr:ABC transporter [Limnochorda pilosa]
MRRGGESLVLTVAVIGILVLVNVLVGRAGWQADLSAEGRFTLSPQSLKVLRELPGAVQVTAFVREGSGGPLEDLLQQYARASDRFRLRLVDPVKEPSVAQQYQIRQYDTVVLEQGGRDRRVEPANLYAPGATQMQAEFRGEQAVTRALVELGREQALKVYFLTGHGESTPADRLAALSGLLEGEGYTVDTLNLAQEGSVPDEASVLVAAGPQSDLDPREREQIQTYVDGGGRLVLLMDPSPRDVPGWSGLAEHLGVRLQKDVVVDPQQSFFLDPLSPMPTLRYHDITRDLQEKQMRVMLPRARSLEILAQEDAPVEAAGLLETSLDAWGETSFQGTDLKKDPEDAAGPMTLAVAVTRPVAAASGSGGKTESASGAARPAAGAAEAASGAEEAPEASQAAPEPVAVVVGNASFLEGQVLGFQGNQDFFLNALNWLAGQEQLISIRPKTLENPTVELTSRLVTRLFYGFVVALPLAVLLAGGAVWWRRRAL